jgi:prepilin-type N-terminal cleavage/methylation domain-containing protein
MVGTRRRLQSERGFALIEIMVSAALLSIVAAGVFAGIDGPAAISGKNQTRSAASNLAQQDQDRMRGMTATQLTGYTNTSPVSVDGVSYSVYSRAIWVRDSSDAASCQIAPDDNSGDYLRITSRVTPPGGAPIELNSLLTPPPGSVTTAKGTLAVQLKDQANAPIVNQSVQIAGPQNMTVPTNSAGCAVFGLVDKGTYNVSFTKTGWVDPDGVNAVVLPTSVTAGSTNVVSHSYAPAATLNVNVTTAIPGTPGTPASPAKAITLQNSGMTTGTRVATATLTNQTSWSLAVFPFATTSYAVWAGGCLSGDPTKYGKLPVTAQPAAGATVGVTVLQPSINVAGANNIPPTNSSLSLTSPPVAGAKVYFTSVDANCAEKYSQVTNAQGKVPFPGAPYGNYRVCGELTGAWAQLDPFPNTNPAGSSPTLPYKGLGTCP